jgi:hypothetical protein
VAVSRKQMRLTSRIAVDFGAETGVRTPFPNGDTGGFLAPESMSGIAPVWSSLHVRGVLRDVAGLTVWTRLRFRKDGDGTSA